ncbi:6-phosphogluconolactonase [Portibacter lacus]|uniref:6-phosphogluconolactonase n=1 Tax=Portibacter lacus TaxID=1099794 RepID=A0AA37SV38_9BACT|nr:6-phosphogluconolactonase [Portibacter lacus]GLR20194.1 6-phosphogluconolactonase [Portibacter lacus]
METKIYKDKLEVAEAFSSYLKDLINVDHQVFIALSGGSTPKAIFDYMAENFKDSIDWANVHFYWGDERCVPPEDAESNYKMTVDHLFSKIDLPKENIHRVKGENDPEAEKLRYAKEMYDDMITKDGVPIFDLVILGMGDDGHTASIFPDSIELWESPNNTEVAVHPDSGQKRITITGQVINKARSVAFLVTGEGKREKVDEILNQKEDHQKYPASLVKPESGNLIWYLDKAAAQDLKG